MGLSSLLCGPCGLNGSSAPIFDEERDFRLTGKVVLITGGNSGIGFATANECAKRGAHVVLLCRDERRMSEAKAQIIKKTPSAIISTIVIDLKSFASVREAAGKVRNDFSSIDIVILNAGAAGLELELIDGIHNIQMINHFSHFLFLNLIFDLLNTRDGNVPRVVAVSSELYHLYGTGDLKFWKKFKSIEEAKAELPSGLVNQTLQAYGESKLAQVLHMRKCAELNKKVRFFSMHPGGVHTEIFREANRLGVCASIMKWASFRICSCCWRSAFEGAQTIMYCAVSPDCENPELSGQYLWDFAPQEITLKNKSDDDLLEIQETLWKLSEEYTSSTLPDSDK